MNKEKGGYKYEGQVKTIAKVNKGKSEEKKNTKAECLHHVSKIYIVQNPNWLFMQLTLTLGL